MRATVAAGLIGVNNRNLGTSLEEASEHLSKKLSICSD
jgi:hypothetical protein